MRIRTKRRAKWRRRLSKDGAILELNPAPVVKDITFDLFERGCLLLGINPDELLTGEIDATKIPEPPISKAQEFVDLVLTRPELYELKTWELDRARYFLAMVSASFIFASFEKLHRVGRSQNHSVLERGLILISPRKTRTRPPV